jgi:hypothetical protein
MQPSIVSNSDRQAMIRADILKKIFFGGLTKKLAQKNIENINKLITRVITKLSDKRIFATSIIRFIHHPFKMISAQIGISSVSFDNER